MVVMAARHSSGSVFFIDTNSAEPTRMNSAEHANFNLVALFARFARFTLQGVWDPTGRFFVTCSTVMSKQAQDLGYRLYTFQGRELVRKSLDRLQQFIWRPRPPVKLPDEKMRVRTRGDGNGIAFLFQMIKKNMKTISQKFEEEDKKERGVASQVRNSESR
jgi:translation initiation factor 3 subunit B